MALLFVLCISVSRMAFSIYAFVNILLITYVFRRINDFNKLLRLLSRAGDSVISQEWPFGEPDLSNAAGKLMKTGDKYTFLI